MAKASLNSSFFILFGLLMLAQQSVQAQAKKDRTATARSQIKDLKDGVLLVRLQTRSKSLEMIRERGMDEKAAEIEAELKAENDEIIAAFQEEYDFSKVYFFNSEDSGELAKGEYDKVNTFDYDEVEVNLNLNTVFFLTAEFSNVQPDTARTRGDYRMVDTEDGPELRSTSNGSTNFGFGALIIMSDQFIQLADPFPSYTRTFDDIFFLRRQPAKVVGKMNGKLVDFY